MLFYFEGIGKDTVMVVQSMSGYSLRGIFFRVWFFSLPFVTLTYFRITDVFFSLLLLPQLCHHLVFLKSAQANQPTASDSNTPP